MTDSVENHTIQLLQEMRSEMRDRFDTVDTRIDGLTHMTMLLAANMGGHEERIAQLEDAMSKLKKS